MYELKIIGKVFTSKSVRTGPSSCGKKNLPGRGLTEVEKHWIKGLMGEKGLMEGDWNDRGNWRKKVI